LACELQPPATVAEIESGFRGCVLPPLVRELWLITGAGRLFADADYGQWGLEILGPAASAEATARERERRPGQLTRDDVVLGRFLGDLESLVVAGDGSVLVNAPLDPREDWDGAASGLESSFRAYFDAEGAKYWDRARSGQ
jgi:hypothetical protein